MFTRSDKTSRGRRAQPVALWACGWLAMSLPSPETVAAENGHVAVRVEGEGAEAIKARIVAALPSGIDAIDAPQLDEELSRQGLGDLAAAIAGGKRRPVLVKKLRRVDWTIGVDAIIVASVVAGGRKGFGELELLVVLVCRPMRRSTRRCPSIKKGAAPLRQLKNLLETAFEGLRGEAAAADEGTAQEKGEGAGASSG